jgi:hypothetical protein
VTGPTHTYSKYAESVTLFPRVLAYAQTEGVPVSMRVMFASIARADRQGRAEFEPGELRRLTGLGKNTRTQLNTAIRALVAWGVAAPGATSRRIVLNPALADYDRRTGGAA